jgi:hypothetical protein
MIVQANGIAKRSESRRAVLGDRRLLTFDADVALY